MSVTGVDFVSIPTTDIEASVAFYRDVLGLEVSSRWGDVPAGQEFETGTVTLALLNNAHLGIPFQANKVPIALQVDDVHQAREALEARGVTFVADTIDSGVCHMANFEDPDGNALMLHHRYAPRS
jgi:catechol 2,3-dioxygenase-like lactoylglutathione lyase family enzyme